VHLAYFVRGQYANRPLRLETPRLVHRRLQRAEAVAAMDKRDRSVGRVLEPERPVQRRVASADDHASLAGELGLLLDDVVQTVSEPLVDVVDAELSRLERTVAGGHDQRSGEIRPAFVRRERVDLLAVLAPALQRIRLLAEDHLGAVLKALLDAQVDEVLAEDLRVPGDVVDVLLRIGRRDLAAELLEALDDANGGVPVARVVRSRQSNGTCPENRDVDDALGAHRA
jgi:hypothetical protein